MPDAMTHVFMGEDVLNTLHDVQIDRDIFLLGTQGPDPLFYHHMLPFQKKSTIPRLGNLMHDEKTDDFMHALIHYVKSNDSIEARSFLYGLVCHHILDYHAHPFVYYYTGEYDKKKPETTKYRGKHLLMERHIDGYFIKTRLKRTPSHFRSYAYFLKKTVPTNIQELLDHTIKEVYGEERIGTRYQEAVLEMRTIFKYGVLDRFGLKRLLFKMVDAKKPASSLVYQNISSRLIMDPKQFLNLEHKRWHHPSKPEETSTYSFIDLMEQATEKAAVHIRSIEGFLNENKAYMPFEGYSYSTRMPWKESIKPYFFAY